MHFVTMLMMGPVNNGGNLGVRGTFLFSVSLSDQYPINADIRLNMSFPIIAGKYITYTDRFLNR